MSQPEKKKMMKKLNVNAVDFVPDFATGIAQIPPPVVEQKVENNVQAATNQQKPKKPLKMQIASQVNEKVVPQQANNIEVVQQIVEVQQPIVVVPAKTVEIPKVEAVLPPVKVAEVPTKLVVNYELISYFLDKDVVYEVQDDDRYAFDKRLVSFLNRKYEVGQGKGESFNRNGNKNMTAKPNSTYPRQYNNNNNNNNNKPNYNGNSFPTGDNGSIQRNDVKKMTAPVMNKSQSQSQQSNTTIKRVEEDKDVTSLKMKIKQQSAQFLEKMRSNKLDSFKKQISDIRLDLNILTPTNFEIIRKKLYTLAMSDELLCEYVVEGIIEKARTQKTYSLVYADLCKFMIEESKREFCGKDSVNVEKSKTFKNHLYTNIQQTFEGEKDIYNNRMTFHKQRKMVRENSAVGPKYDEKSGITRAKEFWGYLDAKVKLQEDYTVQNAVNDFKQFKEECDPIVYGEILIKTVYDCNKNHKDDRLQAAKEAVTFIKPEQFVQAFNERLNKSKDESSDFPLFLEFLSELFIHIYKQGTIKFSQLKISYKDGYDEDDKEDLNFVYMSFFEESINLLKQGENFNVANFIKEEIDLVLKDKDPRYNNWVKDMSK